MSVLGGNVGRLAGAGRCLAIAYRERGGNASQWGKSIQRKSKTWLKAMSDMMMNHFPDTTWLQITVKSPAREGPVKVCKSWIEVSIRKMCQI